MVTEQISTAIRLRNANGKWMMSANIESKHLPEREITRDDATAFKQGLQTMSDIVLKHYADYLTQAQQPQTNRRGINR